MTKEIGAPGEYRASHLLTFNEWRYWQTDFPLPRARRAIRGTFMSSPRRRRPAPVLLRSAYAGSAVFYRPLAPSGSRVTVAASSLRQSVAVAVHHHAVLAWHAGVRVAVDVLA
ncbi:hypothetical protein GCM10010129_82730 [Streptomyces fumigatiscleroticus]|nr:hypothetical protein GCM10010129_82730 [Streptomyces fumigatiscleroticus]